MTVQSSKDDVANDKCLIVVQKSFNRRYFNNNIVQGKIFWWIHDFLET